jgi:RNA polymerase sigma-70 factor (ECF subfamily)
MTILFATESGIDDYLDPKLSHQERFADLLKKCESSLIHYVSRLRGNLNSEAEDFVQETFMRFHHKVNTDGWESVANPPSWLYRVAHNLVMDAGRRKKVEKQHIDEVVRNAPPVKELNDENSQLGKMIRDEAGKKALAVLQQLPEEDREVLLLKIIQGFTLKEISEITGENIGKTAYRVNRSLEKLHELLQQAGVI